MPPRNGSPTNTTTTTVVITTAVGRSSYVPSAAAAAAAVAIGNKMAEEGEDVGALLFHCVQDTLDSEDEMSVATPVGHEHRTILQRLEKEGEEGEGEGGGRRRHHHHKHKKKKRSHREPEQPPPPQQPPPQQQPQQQQRPPLIHKMSLPTVIVHSADDATSTPQQQHRKAKKKTKRKKAVAAAATEDNDDKETESILRALRRRAGRSHSLTNVPPPPLITAPRRPAGDRPPTPIPPKPQTIHVAMVPQIFHEPPTPTTPTDPILPQPVVPTDPAAASATSAKPTQASKQTSPGGAAESAASSASASSSSRTFGSRTRTVPLLNLPQVCSPGDDDEDNDEDNEKDIENNDDGGGSGGIDLNMPDAPCQIKIECEEEDRGGKGGQEDTPTKSKKKQRERGRKRRRSLVNLFFPSKNTADDIGGSGGGDSSNTPTATTPTLKAPEGQRLHFRRVSEIFSRSSGSSAGGEPSSLKTMSTEDLSSAGSASPPECSGGLSIRNLFPYRRRRSSVSHLDNTDQFRESREEVLQSQRRRMSSFPPMDGDEAAIMLEKANVVRLEQAHQEALALQAGPVVGALRRLRRGSRSPSPMSFFPGLNKNKKSRWKSSTDIHSDQQQPSSLPTHIGNGNSRTGVSAKDVGSGSGGGSGSVPPPLLSSLSVTNAFGYGSGNVNLPSFPNVPCDAATAPPPTPSADASGPSSLPADVIIRADSVTAATAAPETPRVGRRPVFVFPKRKVEDVPGIFIPKSGSGGGKSRAADDGDTQLFSSAAANLLSVMRSDRPRRHSMGDPAAVAALQCFAQSVNPDPIRPILLPRSPYSTDCATTTSGGGLVGGGGFR